MNKKYYQNIKKAYKEGRLNKEIFLLEDAGEFFAAGYRTKECGLFKRAIENFNKIVPECSEAVKYELSNISENSERIKFREEFGEYFKERDLKKCLKNKLSKKGEFLPEYIKISN